MDDEFETLSLFPDDREHVSPPARRLVVLVAGLAVITGAAVGIWQHEPDREPGLAPTRQPVQEPLAAYLPGGSVYDQQVPQVIDWSTAYGPGSSTYWSQVPRSAR
jgi:hypothetical protein